MRGKTHFLKNIFIYGAFSVVARFSALLTAPLVTSMFTVEEYGMVDTLNVALAIAALLIGLNLDSGVFRLYYEKSSEQKRVLLSSTLLFYLAVSLSVTATVLFFPKLISKLVFGSELHSNLVIYSILRFPLMLAFQQFTCLLRIRNEAFRFAIFNLLLLVGNVAAVGGLYLSNSLTVENLILYQSYVQIGLSICLFIMVRRHYAFSFNRSYFREITDYTLPQMPSLLINFLLMGTFPLIITRIGSLYETGLYGVANRFAVLFGILIFAFRAAYDPIMMKLMADKTKEHFSRVSRESWTFYLCLLLPLLLYIYAVPYVFPYLIDEKFNAALKLIPILCLATFLTGCTNILGLGIAYTKRTKYMSYAQVCAFIVFISLVYPLINMYGSLGAAIVYLVSVTVQNIAIYFFSNRLIPIDYAMGKSALVIGVMAFAICIPVVWLQVVAFCGAAVYFGRQIQKNRLLALLSNT